MGQGVGEAELDEAEAGGWLAALLVDRVLLAVPTPYTVAEVAERVGTTTEVVRRILRAQGIPEIDGDRATLSERDVAAFRVIIDTINPDTFEHGLAISLGRIRAISAAMARIAEVSAEVMADLSESVGDPDQLMEEIEAQAPLIAGLIDYTRNVQIRLALQRRIAAGTLNPTQRSAVGFADLAGFTALSTRVGPAELEAVVSGFETAAYDAASRHGGRIVKTIGDAVMFTAPEAPTGLAFAEELTKHTANESTSERGSRSDRLQPSTVTASGRS